MAANLDSPNVSYTEEDASGFVGPTGSSAAFLMTDASKGRVNDGELIVNRNSFIGAHGKPELSKPSMHSGLAIVQQTPFWSMRVASGAVFASSIIQTLEMLVGFTSGTEVTPAAGNNPATYSDAQLSATASKNDASEENVTATATWSSSDEAVATVDTSGAVTGVATGSVTITAEFEGVSASYALAIEIV